MFITNNVTLEKIRSATNTDIAVDVETEDIQKDFTTDPRITVNKVGVSNFVNNTGSGDPSLSLFTGSGGTGEARAFFPMAIAQTKKFAQISVNNRYYAEGTGNYRYIWVGFSKDSDWASNGFACGFQGVNGVWSVWYNGDQSPRINDLLGREINHYDKLAVRLENLHNSAYWDTIKIFINDVLVHQRAATSFINCSLYAGVKVAAISSPTTETQFIFTHLKKKVY